MLPASSALSGLSSQAAAAAAKAARPAANRARRKPCGRPRARSTAAAAMTDPAARNTIAPDGRGPGPMGPTRIDFAKPVVAAIEGYAVAGGLELALMCDLRVAARSAVFGIFCRRWGVPLIDGGTVRLPRVVGQGRALDMILTGRPVGADEALAMGLANRVVDDGQALAAAQALARELAALPQRCMRADRASAIAQWDWPLAEALRREGEGGYAIVFEEGLAGAARFAAGAGRGGTKG
ncbi:MAG: crotonase/enoyl-CoA hydratase family protein [Elusimicrobia bacterium]|nr:crotonase/enoyl-CoA hydratase family protein [Elusimicrobiota bacterium]